MSTSAIALSIEPLFPATDHGVSTEARRLRELLIKKPEDSSYSSAVNEPRSQAFEHLNEVFREAQEENWDGEGAAPADLLSYEYAQSFLLMLPSWVPNPDVFVDPDGEICFEWDKGRRVVFSVSIGRDGTLTYAGLFGATKRHGVEPFVDNISEVILDGIHRTTGQLAG